MSGKTADLASENLGFCPACGCRLWLVDQMAEPFSAQLELVLLGHPLQLVAFRPARGPPERLLP